MPFKEIEFKYAEKGLMLQLIDKNWMEFNMVDYSSILLKVKECKLEH